MKKKKKKERGCFPQNIYGNHAATLSKKKIEEGYYEVKGLRIRKKEKRIQERKAFHRICTAHVPFSYSDPAGVNYYLSLVISQA